MLCGSNWMNEPLLPQISGVSLMNVGKMNLLTLAPGGHVGRFCIWTESAISKVHSKLIRAWRWMLRQCVHPIGSIAWLWFQRHLCMVVNQADPEIIPYLTFPIDTIYNLLNTQQTSCVWSLCNKTPFFAISSWMPYMELGARLHQWKPITIYPNLFYQTVTLQNYFIVMKFK